MGILDKLRPAPFQPEIQDPDRIKQDYKYWRLRIFYSMYVGYAFYYFTRKSFTFAIPSMLDQGYTLAELGILGSILSITYGISKFVSGIIGDKSNPRYFMSLGLILTGIFNICFGFSSMWTLFAVFWALNAFFQGWGWPGCAKLLTHWYSQSERGRWWSVWNTSHNAGGALVPIIAAFCVYMWGWRFALFIPGLLSIGVGIFLMNRLRDIPQSLGLPTIEKFKGEKNPATDEEKVSLSAKEILFKYVLRNKFLWMLAIAYFFIYIIRTGVNDWIMVYFVKQKGYSQLAAGSAVLWFEIGGFLGSLLAGWTSDKIFKGKRNPINVLFTFGTICMLLVMHLNPINYPIFDFAIVFLIGFFIFGPQMMIGMAAAEITHKKAAATSSGFAGCFAYLGAAVAGGPLALFTHTRGWDAFFIILSVCGLLALAMLIPLWSVKSAVKPAVSPVLVYVKKDEEES